MNTFSRRAILALVLCALVCLNATAFAEKDAWRFIVMGDNRPGKDTPVKQPLMYLRAIDEINLLDPDLAVNVGDLILGYVDDPQLVGRMWDEFERVSAGLEVPWYRVFGNHDIWDEVSQKIAKERYGPLYYSFTHKNAYFAVLCSDLVGEMKHITGDQLEWLKKDLKRHRRAKWKFVYVHRPLWQEQDSNWLDEVHPLLAERGVNMVFAGHAHKYEKSRTRDGVQYFITGGVGAPLREDRTPEQGWFYHYMQIAVRGDSLTVAVIRTGHIDPENIITYETK
ncbi:MAG: hypothetical protein GWP08_00385 [Nitrospiraceae bacterium]|nr:hypothetical protein [Nitrospiraceae bacterium]